MFRKADGKRVSLSEALDAWTDFERALGPARELAHLAGSVRRAAREVGDVDFVFTGAPTELRLLGFEGGQSKLSCLRNGILFDALVCQPEQREAALLHMTGSMQLNVGIRAKAARMGMKLNERGLWRGDALVASTEHAIFEALRLPFLEPEMR